MMHEQPITLGFIGVALGAIAAVGISREKAEDHLMGDARDRLAEKAARADAEQTEQAEHGLEAANDGRRDEKHALAEETSPAGV